MTLAQWGIGISLNEPPQGTILVAENLTHIAAIQQAKKTREELFAKGIKDFVQIVPRDADRYSVYRIPEEAGK